MHGPYHINGKFGSKCSLFSFHSHLPDSFVFILDPQTYITYYHNWLRMAVIGILPFSAICCLNLRIFLAVRSKPKICWRKTSHKQHHLGGDACLEIMISGATTTTSPRSRGTTHSGAHRHRHHLPDMQPAQVQYRRVEPLIPTKISSLSSMSLSGWSSICTRCSSSTGSTNVENPHLADSQSGALCLDLSPTFFWSSSSYKIHSHAWSIGHNLSNNHQCRHTLVSTFVLGFASHVLLADITIFIMMLIFFTWAYFFSSKVVNSSANLFIYCAIGARYFFNAFCVKNFMSASLITLSNNHIFQKSYTMWTSYRDGHYSVAHNTPDNHSVNADSEPNAGSTFVVAGTLLDANAPRPPLRWELCRL